MKALATFKLDFGPRNGSSGLLRLTTLFVAGGGFNMDDLRLLFEGDVMPGALILSELSSRQAGLELLETR